MAAPFIKYTLFLVVFIIKVNESKSCIWKQSFYTSIIKHFKMKGLHLGFFQNF